MIAVLGVIVTATMWWLRRPMFAVVTDEGWAKVAGLPVGALNSVLAAVTALAVVAAMRVVGILLIAAMMVLPVASAQLLARSFRSTLAYAVGVGVASTIVGLGVARLWDIAPSGAIVLVTAVFFGVVSIAKRTRCPVDRMLEVAGAMTTGRAEVHQMVEGRLHPGAGPEVHGESARAGGRARPLAARGPWPIGDLLGGKRAVPSELRVPEPLGARGGRGDPPGDHGRRLPLGSSSTRT